MNRSLLSLAALTAIYSAASSFDTRRFTDNIGSGLAKSLHADDDAVDPGAPASGNEEAKKVDTIEDAKAKGVVLGEGSEQAQQQAETLSAAAPGTVLADNKVDDGAGSEQAKAISDPPRDEQQQ